MGAKYTEGQARAIEKYMQDKQVIRITVPKEKAREIREAAEAEGKSVSRFIMELINQKMEANSKEE